MPTITTASCIAKYQALGNNIIFMVGTVLLIYQHTSAEKLVMNEVDPVQEQSYSVAKSLLVVSIPRTTASRRLQPQQQHHDDKQQLEDNTPVEECNQNHENEELIVK